jgi:hypothetical protein
MSDYRYNYNSNSSNENRSDIYKKIEEAKGTIFKEESLNNANIAALLEKAEGKSPTLLEPTKSSKILFDKPICDPIGFKQHSGECANDAFQQLLLFADDLKDITQPKMFDTELHSKIDDSELKKYIKYMQKRFIEHYGIITGQTTEKAKRRMSFIASSICHEFFPDQLIHKRIDDYRDIKNALGLAKYRLELDGKIDGPGYIMSMYIERQKGKEIVRDETTGHVVALYKCGGKYYLADNEASLVEINEEIYKNPDKWMISRRGSTNVIIIPKLIKSKGEIIGIEAKKEWKEGAWEEAKGDVEDEFKLMKENVIVIRGQQRKRGTRRKAKKSQKARVVKP